MIQTINCAVMGIVNVTPDSFSDVGRFFKPEEAIRRARNLVADGASIIDIGAESTRPDASPISWQEEWSRLEPVLRGLVGVRLSVDTYHPETADLALRSGVRMINCVRSEPVLRMVELCARHQAELVIPARDFDNAIDHTNSLACPRAVWLDPMIGFGTTREQDLALLRSIPDLTKKGRVLVGASRKRIVRRLSGEHGVGKLVGGSVAVALWCAAHGASMVRVHDVRETVEAISAWSALQCRN